MGNKKTKLSASKQSPTPRGSSSKSSSQRAESPAPKSFKGTRPSSEFVKTTKLITSLKSSEFIKPVPQEDNLLSSSSAVSSTSTSVKSSSSSSSGKSPTRTASGITESESSKPESESSKPSTSSNVQSTPSTVKTKTYPKVHDDESVKSEGGDSSKKELGKRKKVSERKYSSGLTLIPKANVKRITCDQLNSMDTHKERFLINKERRNWVLRKLYKIGGWVRKDVTKKDSERIYVNPNTPLPSRLMDKKVKGVDANQYNYFD